MIFDSIKNKDLYKENKKIYQALQYLSNLDEDTLPKQMIELDGDRIFLNPVEFISKPEEECLFEAHKKYMDLHYIIKGTEGIKTADTDILTEVQAFDEKRDIGFYEGKEDGMYYLKSGQFIVCWPSDAHKVGIMEKLPEKIMKLVVKIKVEE